MRLSALAVASIVLLCMTGCEFEASQHHRPNHTGGPPSDNNGNNGNDGNDADAGDETDADNDNGNGNGNEHWDCIDDSNCEEGEGCTQGGQCIDITGTTSVASVLQSEIDDLPDSVGMGVPYELPLNAKLRIDDENGDGVGLKIHDGIVLEGNGSRLVVENDMIGIRLVNGAAWSSVKNLRIDPQEPGIEHAGIGIDVRAHGVRLENLMIRRMGTGIRAHTQVEDLDPANVNTQQWSRIILQRNFEHGLHVQSGDSNAGLFSGIEILGGGGIQDDSFLGNTYIAPVIQNSDSNSSMEITSAAGASTVLGLYVEDSSADPSAKSLSDVHLGGNAIRRLQTTGDRIGSRRGRIRFGNAEGIEMRIPAGPNEPFGYRHPAEDGKEWRLRYTPSWRQWGISFIETASMPYRWTGAKHPQGPGKYELGEEMQ